MLFAFTDGDVWRPGIGDPGVMGWVTVAAYLAAAIACWLAAQSSSKPSERALWLLLAVAMCFLGINKQLDLQTWFTITMRRLALAQGWYESRRALQFVFILFVAGAGLLSCAGLFRVARRHTRIELLAVLGLAFVAAFVIVRAASFHHVDLFLKSSLGGVRMNWLFELSGIVLIAGSAWWKKKHGAAMSDSSTPFGMVPRQGSS